MAINSQFPPLPLTATLLIPSRGYYGRFILTQSKSITVLFKEPLYIRLSCNYGQIFWARSLVTKLMGFTARFSDLKGTQLSMALD